MERSSNFRKNKFSFGMGTIGRDMVYTMVSMYLMVFITEVVGVSDQTLITITTIMMVARVFDAFNDPIMGVIIDNTRSRIGKYKPWIVIGLFMSAFVAMMLFTDMGLTGTSYIIYFTIFYILWDVAWTMNDISYWSMMPSLSYDQKEREEIGALSRIFANIGLFVVVASVIPVTNMLGEQFGSKKTGFLVYTGILVIIMIVFQMVTVFGVKEPPVIGGADESKTDLKGMLRALFQNDQLLVTAVAMALFMIGYVTTTSFGVYYFKYVFLNEEMYSVFAIVLGVSQILALLVFPWFSRRHSRKTLYGGAIILIVLGYLIFFFSPANMIFIGAAGILLFVGQAFIQLLMLVFLADTIEYGHLKLGKRNESVTFAIQPFINKMGAAVANGIVGYTLVISGINSLNDGELLSQRGLLIMKSAMMLLPLLLIVLSFFIYRKKYIIDEKTYGEIIEKLVIREEDKKEVE
ncbi:glycoside-pentoside-hexuronide (GPH):cation symporter [Proteiniclasticum sp.]|uniref:glycoside-pentoside-hexuronide (GPH):cation symporter n=1 Tax=Proteiniclasticum sp. TaxID=2053595 RepID=UPI002898375F|nr:glycoside-pentoside-hexuronide (GPH):cation symporter [Proteiniclasticum sp.]